MKLNETFVERAKALLTEGSLNELQKKSATALLDHGFPSNKHEDWKYLRPSTLLDKDMDLASVCTLQASGLPSWNDQWICCTDGNWSISEQLHSIIEKVGGTIEISNDGLAESIFSDEMDSFANLTSALGAQNLKISIPANKAIDKPIYFASMQEQGDHFTQSSIQIKLAKNAEMHVIEYVGSDKKSQSWMNALLQIEVADDARMRWTRIQDIGEASNRTDTMWASVGKQADLSFNVLNIGGKIIRNQVNVHLAGEAANADIRGASITGDKQVHDNCIVVYHDEPSTTSDEYFKSVAGNSSTVSFSGKIVVDQKAQLTNAYQTNRSMLLSDKARSNSKPQLEIYADDVKCSHGSTSGQIDTDAQFYLMTRGIPQESARTMLTEAFINEAVDSFPADIMKDEMHAMINKKIRTLL